ncbi:YadA-like family protein [Escherichia coli]|uniref:YadA-like family protein n=1 Tax=Escherichia coli TaxID=562 RepID=UPI000E1D95CC|nr:YadA-like family protein [Escherichia coli]MCJ2699228.1 YadA-like family protein [Escherichia coli]RDS54628.1 Adhesin YadA precursor [Escherichia coli]
MRKNFAKTILSSAIAGLMLVSGGGQAAVAGSANNEQVKTDSAKYNTVVGDSGTLKKTEQFNGDSRRVFSTSVGSQAFAVKARSTAIGADSYAKEEKTTAVGAHAQATQKNSTAVGMGSHAYSKNSVAAGASSHVDDNAVNSVALGAISKVTAANGVSVGAGASATHDNSVALGTKSVTTRNNEVYIGYEVADGKTQNTRVLGGVSDGARDSDAATVGQLNRKVDKETTFALDADGDITLDENQGSGERYSVKQTVADIKADTTVYQNEDGSYTLDRTAPDNVRVNDAVVSLDNKTRSNTQAIQSNSRQLQEHDVRLNSQQRQIRENHEEMKRAAAQSAALAGLFQPYSVGKFNATAALGGYSDKQAVAVGVGYRFNEQTAAKAGIAASDGDVSYNVGVNFEF